MLVVTSSSRLQVSGWLMDDVPQRAGFSSVGMRTGSPVCPVCRPTAVVSHRIASHRSIRPTPSPSSPFHMIPGFDVSFLFLQQIHTSLFSV